MDKDQYKAVSDAALQAVNVCHRFEGKTRTDYLEMLGCAAIEWMRATGGDEYTRGWLTSALASVERPSAMDLIRSKCSHN